MAENKTKELMPSLHKSGVDSDFYSLIDRLKIHSEWKYPNRIWTNTVYYDIAWEWIGKEKQLEERVLELEEQMKNKS